MYGMCVYLLYSVKNYKSTNLYFINLKSTKYN